jgi:DNA polymerase-1
MPAPLLVCDLPLLMYRGFFALPSKIRGADGKPVNALLGTANAVLAAIEELKPRAVVMCDGAEAGAYRVKAFPGYHAAREPMPPELAHQFELGPTLWKALGWKLGDAGDLEADDLMATLALIEAEAGGTTRILTGDRDLLQCATSKTKVMLLKPGQGTVECGPKQVEEITGVKPSQIPDLIALRGDPSDGIPGAPGIGAKGAADLLGRHGSLEKAIAEATGEKPRTAASLADNAELLRTFKEVATIQKVKGARRPADALTNFSRGAKAAEDIGMARLAARLADLTAA